MQDIRKDYERLDLSMSFQLPLFACHSLSSVSKRMGEGEEDVGHQAEGAKSVAHSHVEQSSPTPAHPARLTVDEIKVLKRSFEDSKAKVEKVRRGTEQLQSYTLLFRCVLISFFFFCVCVCVCARVSFAWLFFFLPF